MKALSVKDIMVTGAFSALYFVCVGLGTLLSLVFDHSGNMMYAPAMAALLAGPVYMVLIARVGKFGAVSLVGAVMAAFFSLSGYLTASFIPSLLFGFLADVIANIGAYRQKWLNLISFVVFSFGNLGPIFLMWFMRDAYIESLIARGKSAAYISRVMLDFNFGNVLWLFTTIIVCALISGWLGQGIVKKYFKSSGLL